MFDRNDTISNLIYHMILDDIGLLYYAYISNSFDTMLSGIDHIDLSAMAEVWTFLDDKQLVVSTSNSKIRINTKLFELDFVHSSFNRCTSMQTIENFFQSLETNEEDSSNNNSSTSQRNQQRRSTCSCRELFIITNYISSKAKSKSSRPQEIAAFERLMTERLLHSLIHQSSK